MMHLLLPLPLLALVEVSVHLSSVHAMSTNLVAAVETAHRETSPVLLRLHDGEDAGKVSEATHMASLSIEQRVAFFRDQAQARHVVRSATVPVIAVAPDGPLSGVAAGLFLAASHRIASLKTTYAVPDCRSGYCPAHGAIGVLARLDAAHIANAVALGALELNAHDLTELGLATHYVPSAEALHDMTIELRASPGDFFDVPLSRRTRKAPPLHLVPLYASEQAAPLYAALQKSFGDAVGSVEAMRLCLERQRMIATSHAAALATEPCGIHIRTQERALAVASALESASAALNPQCSCPEALATTYAALRVARSKPAETPAAILKQDLALDLALDSRLHARADSGVQQQLLPPELAEECIAFGKALEPSVAAEITTRSIPMSRAPGR
mmetsp:Transcript_44071/g.115828  ORF Transcript_44071/g.115828 Transcript_44071/m.115828 type:complete len:386 (+) Transcript_44071:33-1190(+)|eukprot:CAMPEP_0115849836 /NCGR_PEP_ID=MMETSP0287-20121206/11655_1 /TAXON_ID=412157 /ORGANISM="Chrysochromulina rotalis, Strain UIO044" /LENGTH=385 /DNA_ID=CAMNT_0003303817 /DNA_START=31 /DNA_END=1188 /DNA_ORIENTATION=-